MSFPPKKFQLCGCLLRPGFFLLLFLLWASFVLTGKLFLLLIVGKHAHQKTKNKLHRSQWLFLIHTYMSLHINKYPCHILVSDATDCLVIVRNTHLQTQDPVWPSGKALGWYADRGTSVQFRLGSPFSSNRVISVDTVFWLCPSQLTKHYKGSHRCPS